MKTANALSFVLLAACSAPIANADTFGSGTNTFDIDFVTIGNPGNDFDYSFNPDWSGRVDYSYHMGKFEISEQMIDTANALGQLGITKDTRGPNKPATSVNWNEAARFINWLNTSTGNMPAYKFSLQPGQDGYNPNADIQLWTPSDAGYNPNNLYRNKLAKYFLPSEDEWYKAAYYDPNSSIYDPVYYLYPTGSNSKPDGIGFPGDPSFDGVFQGLNQSPISGPNDITNVGVLSPYGIAGLGGNVSEWAETDYFRFGGPEPGSSSTRIIRGGNWSTDYLANFAGNPLIGTTPSIEYNFLGFRVASVPEPNTLLLSVLASLGVLARKKR